MSELVRLARETVVWFALHATPPPPRPLCSPLLRRRGAAFVSIYRACGGLRGCWGTFIPHEPTLADEITRNSIGAASRDPRYPPVAASELDELSYSVDVLTLLREVQKLEGLAPNKDGLLVVSGEHYGLLLPGIAGIETPWQQYTLACRKADIPPDVPAKLYTFRVQRFA